MRIQDSLYIRRYYIRPFRCAPRVCRIYCVGHCIFYGMVYNIYTTLSRGITVGYPNRHFIFWYTHEPLCECVYQEKTIGIFHGLPREIFS